LENFKKSVHGFYSSAGYSIFYGVYLAFYPMRIL
jgi:hypothetical protein